LSQRGICRSRIPMRNCASFVTVRSVAELVELAARDLHAFARRYRRDRWPFARHTDGLSLEP
jgi:hypothetical protein